MNGTYEKATTGIIKLDLGRPIGGSGLTAIDVLIVELEDDEGRSGLGFSYALGAGGPAALVAAKDLLAGLVEGQSITSPQALWRRLHASLNRSGRGVSYLAIAAIDVAAWDLHAKRTEVPLGVALGGDLRSVPVYGSAGFRPNMDPTAAAEQALRYVERGCTAIKLRLSGNHADVVQMRGVRAALPDEIDIAVDVTEKCDLLRARWLASACADYGIIWLEEPLPAHDIDGFRALANQSPVPIASGEHLQGQVEFAPYLKAGLFALAQPDLAMMGGMTECLRTTQLAEACNIPVSPHFLPSLFVHLAAACPNIRMLEDFPLLEPLFEDPVEMAPDGTLTARGTPGHGIRLTEDARRSLSYA